MRAENLIAAKRDSMTMNAWAVDLRAGNEVEEEGTVGTDQLRCCRRKHAWPLLTLGREGCNEEIIVLCRALE